MLKRFCNKCGKDLSKQVRYEIEVDKWLKTNLKTNNDGTGYFPKFYDLCEDCYKELLKFLGEEN